MKKLITLLVFLFVTQSWGDTPPPGTVKVKGGTDGTVIGNVGDALKISGSFVLPTNAAQEAGGHLASMDTKLSTINTTLGSPFQSGGSIGNSSFGISGTLPAFTSTPTFNLGTLNGAATASNQLTVIGDLGTLITNLGSPFQAGGSIGNTSFGISGTLPAFASTPTFNLGTLNGAATNATLLTINTTLGSPFQSGGSIGNTSFGISGTLPAFSSTPTFNLGTLNGASTAANQSTEITSLSTIATNTTGVATAANQTTANTSLSTIATNTTGVATAANQSTANTSLSTIATNTGNGATSANQTNGSQKTQMVDGSGNVAPAGDAAARATFVQTIYATGTVVNNTSITTTPTTFSAPSNAIGFILEAESGNTANIRWAVGTAASTTVGSLAEPGRDTGLVPLGANISVASVSGTQTISIQWVSR